MRILANTEDVMRKAAENGNLRLAFSCFLALSRPSKGAVKAKERAVIEVLALLLDAAQTADALIARTECARIDASW